MHLWVDRAVHVNQARLIEDHGFFLALGIKTEVELIGAGDDINAVGNVIIVREIDCLALGYHEKIWSKLEFSLRNCKWRRRRRVNGVGFLQPEDDGLAIAGCWSC